jgi:hypothetical protein
MPERAGSVNVPRFQADIIKIEQVQKGILVELVRDVAVHYFFEEETVAVEISAGAPSPFRILRSASSPRWHI